MRRLAGLCLAVVAVAALSGCALPTERPRLTERWSLSASPGEGARLVLGVPDSDDVRLTLTCRPRASRVDLTIVGWRGDPAVLELHSGDVWQRYSGAGRRDGETAGRVVIDLTLPVSDPVLAHLADTGELSIVFPAQRQIAMPNAFAPAHDFMEICRSGR